jgi:copper resistance protein B
MPAPEPGTKAADPHAGHDMPQGADPHAAHQADPHAGHDMGEASAGAADPHAGHDMPAAEAASPPLGPPPPGALSGPAHAADAVFGGGQMAAAREELRKEHGEMRASKVLIDQLEVRIGNGREGYAWDGQGWIGGDIDKAWFKTEGEGEFGGAFESAEVQALWSHAIDPWFDVQAGIRYDFRPDPRRAYLVLGLQGLAPYWFEVDAAAFLSNKGDVSARVEAEYDLLLTQKLILQPRVEFDLSLQDVPEIGIGSGLSTGEIGARLRYQFRPEFAPYLGLEYERAFGDTAGFRRAAGEKAGGWSFLIGLRTWF